MEKNTAQSKILIRHLITYEIHMEKMKLVA